MGAALEDGYADSNGVRLHYVAAGEGPLVVLLHGFPEMWRAWEHQIPALAAAGFRVLAVDTRGYHLSDRPTSVSSYGVKSLVEDVAAVVRAAGRERASVVGHDWGAGIAWAFAMAHPEMVERIAVLNGPHPERLMRAFQNPIQLMKSWYMFYFQLPALPEATARRNGFAQLLRAFREEPVRPGAYSEATLAAYVKAFEMPGALTAMINYYRAMFRPGTAVAMRSISAPALVIWGVKDRHLKRELAQPREALVPNVTVAYIDEASHWVHHDARERVNDLLIAFLSGEQR